MNLNFITRFLIDNIRDGVKDESLLTWPAWDSQKEKEVWLVGRKVGEKVLPLAVLLSDLPAAVKRYAPKTEDGYDFSQIQK